MLQDAADLFDKLKAGSAAPLALTVFASGASHSDTATCLHVKLRHAKQLAQLIHRKWLMMRR